jgi:hypothetical protein
MVSRSTFSWDHKFATGETTNSRHTSGTNFFMRELLRERSNRRLYRVDLTGGAG